MSDYRDFERPLSLKLTQSVHEADSAGTGWLLLAVAAVVLFLSIVVLISGPAPRDHALLGATEHPVAPGR